MDVNRRGERLMKPPPQRMVMASCMIATAETNERGLVISSRLNWFTRRRLFLITLAVGALVYAQFQFYKLPVGGDRANWDYIAQVIVRGGLPYRDVVNIKSPLSAYIGAVAIVAMRPLGVRDIIAIRLACVAMGLLMAGFTFLLTVDYFDSKRAGVLAAFILLTFGPFLMANSGGIQPKTPMMLFGLIALWAIGEDRPFLAGLFGMLSALSWQPGLLYVGAAGLAFSRYLTSWRDLKVARVIAGAALPLAILIAYFWAAGALRDFYLWTIDFNLRVYGPREMKPLSSFGHYLLQMLTGPFRHEAVYLVLAALGVSLALWREVMRARKTGIRGLIDAAWRHAVLIALFVYFAFCALDYQGFGDFFPFLPYIGTFAGFAMIYLLDGGGELLQKAWRFTKQPAFKTAGFVLILAAVSGYCLIGAFKFNKKFPTLRDQDAEVAEMVKQLGPGDKVYVHGLTEVLVISGLDNASPYYFLDRGKDIYLDRIEPGGFQGWLDRLKAERPKIVALARLGHVVHRQDFFRWMEEEYELHNGRIFKYYVRREGATSPG
jgi:hypothetical protein